jgi:hypothetical protein
MRARLQTSYSDNADILKRSDAIITPIRSQGWGEQHRAALTLSCDMLQAAMERVHVEIEQRHGLKVGCGGDLLLNHPNLVAFLNKSPRP